MNEVTSSEEDSTSSSIDTSNDENSSSESMEDDSSTTTNTTSDSESEETYSDSSIDEDAELFLTKRREIRRDMLNSLVIGNRLLNDIKQNSRDVYERNPRYFEDPFDDNTWPDNDFLEDVLSQKKSDDRILIEEAIVEEFSSRYTIGNSMEVRPSRNKPAIYTIKFAIRQLEALYNTNAFVLKVVPLFDKSIPKQIGFYDKQYRLDEIYNDIRIGYFLNELIYGYEHVLCIHFPIVIDWFPIPRDSIIPKEDYVPEKTFKYCHQGVIMEKCDETLESFLSEYHDLNTVRMITFEVLISLELTYHTHRFSHCDLNLTNIMMKNMNYKNSPLKGKDLVYKRILYHSKPIKSKWYVIPFKDTKGHIVKIIDFGRSTIQAPSHREHIYDDTIQIKENPQKHTGSLKTTFNTTKTNKHLHDKEIRYQGRDKKNVEYDSVMFLFELRNHLQRIMDEREYQVFHKFVKEVFRYESKSDPLIKQTHTDIEYITIALNNSFFNDYTSSDVKTDPNNSIIVSFPTRLSDINLTANDSKEMKYECVVCGNLASHVALFDSGDTHYLCSSVCYDFKYIFNTKTVFR